MADKDLVKYFRDGLKGGYSIEELKQASIQQGWSIEDVNEAAMEVRSSEARSFNAKAPEEAAPKEPKQPGRRTRVITGVCIFGFILSIIMLIMIIIVIGQAIAYETENDVLGANLNLLNSTMSGVGDYLFPAVGVLSAAVPDSALPAFIPALGVIGILAFFLLLKMKKAGMILVMVLGFLNVALNALSFSEAKIPITVVWVLIMLYLAIERKLFSIPGTAA